MPAPRAQQADLTIKTFRQPLKARSTARFAIGPSEKIDPMPKYFAYGSNMSHDQIRERCPSHKFLCAAELRDYELAFTRFSKNRQCGVADVVKAEGHSVWGAVFEMSEADLLELDRHEGAHFKSPAYVRVPVQVFPSEGPPLDAFTYEVFKKSTAGHAPSAEYLGLILEGARKSELPQAYQDTLGGIQAAKY